MANKFLLLMWKNWILQKRKKKQTILEVFMPLFVVVFLLLVRYLIPVVVKNQTDFKAFDPLINDEPVNSNSTADFWTEAKVHGLTTIVYSPCGNDKVDAIMFIVKHATMQVAPCYETAKKLQDVMIINPQMFAGVQFDDSYASNGNTLTKMIKYKLRFPGKLRTISNDWQTNSLYPDIKLSGPRDDNLTEGAFPQYKKEGFLALQKVVSFAIIKVVRSFNNESDEALPQVMLQRFPYPNYVQDHFPSYLKNSIIMTLIFSFTYTFGKTVGVIATEKEKQLKESMKIMGLPGWLHWMAWFTKVYIFLTIIVIIITILLKVVIVQPNLAIFTHSHFAVILLILLLYMCGVITTSFLVSVFFSKASVAVIFADIIWILMFIPYYLILNESLNKQLSTSLLLNSAMALGLDLIIRWEITGEGAQFDNIWRSVSPDDDLVLGHIMMMLIVDAIIYLLIALYVEAVMPGEYGVPKPWYFPVTKTFWCGDATLKKKVDSSGDTEGNSQDKTKFEKEPQGLPIGVQIQHLKKVFRHNKVVVKDMNLNMYEGQITALLGHNGAGKTTTISILTGMFPPTSGTAYVAGYDVRTQSKDARRSLGMCLQHNVLFDDLTVAEHLYFFGRLKGLSSKEIKEEINKYVELLDLQSERNVKSSALSGGRKRKLGVGVALCGNSKVVMLDEPTAGMDPAARRDVWDILQTQKSGKTILLTTHFMDEADLLGDRIAIMAGGQLQCCGSSFFLKKRYGAGYHLVIEKYPNCNVAIITQILREFIPDIKIESNVGTELSYILSQNYSSNFEEMLRKLEYNSKNLGIASFGVSLATLEEVFIKVGTDFNKEESNDAFTDQEINTSLHLENTSLLTGFKLICNQTYAMVMKKALSLWRSWYLFLIQILFAVGMIILSMITMSSVSNDSDKPPLEITLDDYKDAITLIGTTDESNPFYLKSIDYLKRIKQEYKDLKTSDVPEYILKLRGEKQFVSQNQYIVGATIEDNKLIAWFNNNPYHSPPLALSLAMNIILKTYNNDYEITVVNHPLPFDMETKFQEMSTSSSINMAFLILVVFSWVIISSITIIFYVHERVIKAKHLQLVSGTKVLIFWGVSFLWDLLTYLVIQLLVLITVAAFQVEGLRTVSELGRFFLLLFVFAIAMLPNIYVLSFIFKSPATAFSKMTAIGLGSVGVPYIAIMFLNLSKMEHISRIVHWVFLSTPLYALYVELQNMASMENTYKTCENYATLICAQADTLTMEDCWKILWQTFNQTQCKDPSRDYFSWHEELGAGRIIVISLSTAFVLMALLIFCRGNCCSSGSSRRNRTKPVTSEGDDSNEIDSDVLLEQHKVKQFTAEEIKQHRIVLQNITKYYSKFLAVDNVSLAVEQFECFGLLGTNGAGKTTTFKVMTGDIAMSSGRGWLGGYNLRSQKNKVHTLIGYCPQFDAILENLTGREMLVIFGLIRGIQQNETKYVAEKLSKDLDFHRHLDKKVKEYSGGNKRKLSTALAIIGDPPIVFLDEPTTGMDPVTKRNVWNNLSKLRETGKCLVLTSHSMEECEALCTRLAIMVNGRFMCLGSTQHLKTKFNDGYTLTIKIKRTERLNEAARNLEKAVKYKFPTAVLKEHHQELMTFSIADSSMSCSKMFGIMERSKKDMNIEDYSLGQASLEQVFLFFANRQRSEDAVNT